MSMITEVNSLHGSVMRKIARLRVTEGVIDTETLDKLKAELTDESAAGGYTINDEILKESLQRLRRIDQRIDECEEMFHKYNVPRVSEFSSPEACEQAVNEFMRVWRENTKSRRERGWKSLNEWLSLTNLPGGDRARLSEVSLGKRISLCIASYFVLIAQSSSDKEQFDRRIRNVVVAIGCLRVEEQEGDHRSSSVVIETFLLAARNAQSALLSGSVRENFQGRVSVIPAGTESDAVHLILREVLRLEVAYNSPDLPMRLTEEVLSDMADHLLCVIDKKLARVCSAMEKLEEDLGLSFGDEGDHRNNEFAFKELYGGVEKVWDELGIRRAQENQELYVGLVRRE